MAIKESDIRAILEQKRELDFDRERAYARQLGENNPPQVPTHVKSNTDGHNHTALILPKAKPNTAAQNNTANVNPKSVPGEKIDLETMQQNGGVIEPDESGALQILLQLVNSPTWNKLATGISGIFREPPKGIREMRTAARDRNVSFAQIQACARAANGRSPFWGRDDDVNRFYRAIGNSSSAAQALASLQAETTLRSDAQLMG